MLVIKPRKFKDPEGSIPRSQGPATLLCPKPDPPHPVHTLPNYFFKIHFNIILLPMPCLPSGLFPAGFPSKTLNAFLFSASCVVCPAHRILPCFATVITFGEEYISYISPQCSSLQSSLTSSPLSPLSSSAPYMFQNRLLRIDSSTYQ